MQAEVVGMDDLIDCDNQSRIGGGKSSEDCEMSRPRSVPVNYDYNMGPSTRVPRLSSSGVCLSLSTGTPLCKSAEMSRSTQSLNDFPSMHNTDAYMRMMQPRKRCRSGSLTDNTSSGNFFFEPMKIMPRLKELKREACVQVHIADDYAGEKFLVDASHLTAGWSALDLNDGESSGSARGRTKSFSEPVHIFTNSYPSSCSPSPPARVEKQCYSPSMQQIVRNVVFSGSSNESPTRQGFIMRSVSPIAVQSPRLKRKSLENYQPSTKKATFRSQSPLDSAFNFKSQFIPNLEHSLSTSSIDSESCSSSAGGASTRNELLDSPLVVELEMADDGQSSPR
ncbi:hypothetical protein T10_12710 [Trichinella papuae]|uniref:Uncharacterized protein n=1 Tax=Trichinella papuae TaxID=268474 RepID=A0A0V1MM49_9BILA|nr:hypothetical protein T10_12710 [Trichinella papuae]